MNSTPVSPERVREAIEQAKGPSSNSRTLAMLLLFGVQLESKS